MMLIFKPAAAVKPGDLVEYDGWTRRVATVTPDGIAFIDFDGPSVPVPFRPAELVGVLES